MTDKFEEKLLKPGPIKYVPPDDFDIEQLDNDMVAVRNKGPVIRTTPEPDNVNHPPHYKAGDIECIDAIKAALTPEEYRGYLKGNMIKYVWRERLKGGLESIKKALWYGDRIED